MKRKIIIMVLMIASVLLFSVTKDEIIKLSKNDPKGAWKLYLDYILENPTDTSIEQLGKELKLKIELSDNPRLSFLIKQDINDVKKFIKETDLSTSDISIILELFPEIEKLAKSTLENPKYETFLDNIVFLKVIDPEIDIKISSVNLIHFFLNYPTMLSYDVISIIKQKKFAKELGYNILRYIVNNIEKFDEKQYPILNRIADFAKEIGGSFSSRYLDDLEKYVEILTALNSNISEDDIEKLKISINSLSIRNYILSSRIENLSQNKGTSDVSDISNYGILQNKEDKENSKKIIDLRIYLLVILFLIIISFKIVRFYILYFLGLKKAAVKVYKKIVDNDPMNEEKHIRLAQLYEEAGMYDKALEEYNLIKRLKI